MCGFIPYVYKINLHEIKSCKINHRVCVHAYMVGGGGGGGGGWGACQDNKEKIWITPPSTQFNKIGKWVVEGKGGHHGGGTVLTKKPIL